MMGPISIVAVTAHLVQNDLFGTRRGWKVIFSELHDAVMAAIFLLVIELILIFTVCTRSTKPNRKMHADLYGELSHCCQRLHDP